MMGDPVAPAPQVARRGHRAPGARSRLKAGAPSTFSSSATLRACANRYSGTIGECLGLFLRYGWQDADATVDYEAKCCGGINIPGKISTMCAILSVAAVPEAYWKGLEPEDIV
jgi:hypothetical protein